MKFRRTIFGVLAAVISGSALGQTPCSAHSPEHAVPAGWSADTGDTNPPPSRAASGWYRLDHVLVDPTLHRRWAFIANCSHPEWPLQVVALTGPSILPTTAANATPGPQAAPVAVKRVPPAVAMDRPAPSKQPFPPSTRSRQITPQRPYRSPPQWSCWFGPATWSIFGVPRRTYGSRLTRSPWNTDMPGKSFICGVWVRARCLLELSLARIPRS